MSADALARCRAQRVPAGGNDQGSVAPIRISVGGNPNLGPETSHAKTLGVVYSPSHVDGFDVSVDWWQIELDNTITLLGSQFILNDCIRNNNQAACALYTRNADGSINRLLSTGQNIGSQEVEGFDASFNYKLADACARIPTASTTKAIRRRKMPLAARPITTFPGTGMRHGKGASLWA